MAGLRSGGNDVPREARFGRAFVIGVIVLALVVLFGPAYQALSRIQTGLTAFPSSKPRCDGRPGNVFADLSSPQQRELEMSLQHVPSPGTNGVRRHDPPPTLVFRYEYSSGGYGDCIKGLVASMQLAYMAGACFKVDFSRHPFGKVLPFASGIAASPDIEAIPDNDARVYFIVDWASSPERKQQRDRLFTHVFGDKVQPPSAPSLMIVRANLAHSPDLASAASVPQQPLADLARHFHARLYTDVIDGSVLQSYWPPKGLDNLTVFRVGIHLRMGDGYISHASWNKADRRVSDSEAMETALRSIPAYLAEKYAVVDGRSHRLHIFVCADTLDGRKLVHKMLASHEIMSAPAEPIHIGYQGVSDRTNIDKEALNVVREHYTLSSADAVFMASYSGFSRTACLSSAPHAIQDDFSSKFCFERVGAEWVVRPPQTLLS
jgi:hypothetical protein